jgi:hypothetical protein
VVHLGEGRMTDKERATFLQQAFGELQTALDLVVEVNLQSIRRAIETGHTEDALAELAQLRDGMMQLAIACRDTADENPVGLI